MNGPMEQSYPFNWATDLELVNERENFKVLSAISFYSRFYYNSLAFI